MCVSCFKEWSKIVYFNIVWRIRQCYKKKRNNMICKRGKRTANIYLWRTVIFIQSEALVSLHKYFQILKSNKIYQDFRVMIHEEFLSKTRNKQESIEISLNIMSIVTRNWVSMSSFPGMVNASLLSYRLSWNFSLRNCWYRTVNKGADQTASMLMLINGFVPHTCDSTLFLALFILWAYYENEKLKHETIFERVKDGILCHKWNAIILFRNKALLEIICIHDFGYVDYKAIWFCQQVLYTSPNSYSNFGFQPKL